MIRLGVKIKRSFALIAAFLVVGTFTGCSADAVSTAPLNGASVTPVEPSTEPTPTPVVPDAPKASPIGSVLTTSNWAITTYAVLAVPGSASAERIASPGTKFIVADVQACSKIGSQSFSYERLILKDSTGRSWTFWNVQIGAKEPNLTLSSSDIAAGSCTRGWLTFMVDTTAVPASVGFADPVSQEYLAWSVT